MRGRKAIGEVKSRKLKAKRKTAASGAGGDCLLIKTGTWCRLERWATSAQAGIPAPGRGAFHPAWGTVQAGVAAGRWKRAKSRKTKDVKMRSKPGMSFEMNRRSETNRKKLNGKPPLMSAPPRTECHPCGRRAKLSNFKNAKTNPGCPLESTRVWQKYPETNPHRTQLKGRQV